ncbi:hypothetical protein [Mariniphaga sp.]|uniref:hypothetical protein n=1 Tax=Mariniphaga sp. TaxID=1954475 RepID=UPI003567154F
MGDKKIEIVRESGTHTTLKLPVDGHDLVVQVDKMNFTISIPYFEFMQVESIVKLIVQLYKENKDNPVINDFLRFLRQPENKEELQSLQKIYRLFHNSH